MANAEQKLRYLEAKPTPPIKSATCMQSSGAILHIAATQRVPLKLGQGYNVRNDTAINFNIFRRELADNDVLRVDARNSVVRLVDDASLNDKFKALDISGELKVSVMAGIINVEGCGRYVLEEHNESNVIAIHLTSVITTETESVDVFKDNVKEAIAGTRLSNAMDSSHVVTGIIYGGRATCSFFFKETNDTTKEEVMAKLQIKLATLNIGIDAGGSYNSSNREISLSSNVELKLDGDFLVDSALPVNADGIRELFQSLPVKLKQANKGRGVPIGYHLSPLSSLAAVCGFIEKIDIICGQIADDKVEDIAFVMEDSLHGIQNLHSFLIWMKMKLNYFSIKDLDKISKHLRRITRARSKFITEMRGLIELFRNKCDEDTYEDMDNAMEDISKVCSTDSVRSYIAEWDDRVCYVTFLDQLAAKEAVTVISGKASQDMSELVEKNGVFVLTINCDLWNTMASSTQSAIVLFKTLIIEQQQRRLPTSYIVLNCVEPMEVAKLREYLHGKIVKEDVVVMMSGLMESRVWMDPSAIQHGVSLKHRNLPFCVGCPGHFMDQRCSSVFHRWLCNACLGPLEYGYDRRIECKNCGICPVSGCKFKCNEDGHGPDFVPFDSSKQPLSLTREDDEVNLIFIGETGAGKSTTICSIANFFNFETLQDALQNTDLLEVPLPVKFTAVAGGILNGSPMKKDEDVFVEIGDNTDRNEFHKGGESGTQHCKSYIFTDFRSGKRIRLIDVPGIGDTRGIEQDKKNIDHIMAYISDFEHIHGICLVMKANETRLTDTFGYCVMEILSRLHESAVKNIAFLFTFARPSNYGISETSTPLKALLEGLKRPQVAPSLKKANPVILQPTEKNMFFFDNEGFRAVCSKKQGIVYDSKLVENMAESWTKSRDATMQLWSFATNQPAHEIKNTITLNKIRKDVLLLAEPLRVLLQNLERNIASAKAKAMELADLDIDTKDLLSKLYVDSVSLESFKLDKPTTVCTNPKCTETVSFGDAAQTVYKTKCHTGCQLQAVPNNEVNSNGLRGCWAFSNLQNEWAPASEPSYNCRVCQQVNGETCAWNLHMHVTVDYRKVPIKVPLIDMKMKIDSKEQLGKAIRDALDRLKVEQQEQENERDILTKASAQFASFIVHNSVAAVNYHALELLKKQIANLESTEGTACERVKTLEEIKRTMEEEIEILKKAYEVSVSTGTVCKGLAPSTVEAKIKELCELKHSGRTLREAFEKIKNAEEQYKCSEKVILPKVSARKIDKPAHQGFFSCLFRTNAN